MVSLPLLLKQHRNGLSAFLATLVALFLLVAVRPDSDRGQALRETILSMVGPVQRLFVAPVNVFVGVRNRIRELHQLDRDNRLLRGELAQLRPLGVRLEELELENRRLRSLLGMRTDPSRREVAARVTGDSSSAFARSFMLNAGRLEGVETDATVLASGGLLGRVVERSDHSALVLTLLDINSRVPVLVQRTRTRAIAAGRNGRLLSLEFVPANADIQPGDLIVTSGTGGFFPKGLLVGRVHPESGGGQGAMFTVEPTVDFDRTEEVRILLPTSESSPGGQPTDAADESTPEAGPTP